MTAARPAARSLLSPSTAETCLRFRGLSLRSTAPPAARHGFHTSARRPSRRRPRFRSISADEMAKIREANKMTEAGLEPFRKLYSPEQVASVKAAADAIDPVDVLSQWQQREDLHQLGYMEDFATIMPSVDKKPRVRAPPSPHARWVDRNEFLDSVWDWAKSKIPGLSENMSEGEIEALINEAEISDMDIERWWQERGTMTDASEDVLLENRAGETLGRPTAFASALPSEIPGVASRLSAEGQDEEDRKRDEEGAYIPLKRKTGLTLMNLLNIKTKVILTRSVTNQTRMGKIQSAHVMAIAGNARGWLGVGQFKSVDPLIAREQALLDSLAHMRPIRRYEKRTIYGNVEKKVGGSVVQLFQRPPGFGLRVPARIFEICKMVGIRDLAGRMPRSRNPMNTVKATIEALMDQPDPEEIALGRGQKLVDVRKVYYGGPVL